MPNITSAGTYTKSSPGFEGLAETANKRAVVIAGTLGTSLTLNYIDDQGATQQLEAISSLPYQKELTLNAALTLVSVGSPNLNVTIKS